jgi:xylan 1,4-beta-xylosidase
MGAPKDLSATQIARLMDLTRDQPEISHTVHTDSAGTVAIKVSMSTNDVVLLTLKRTVGKAGH